jgi:hypothetical protein
MKLSVICIYLNDAPFVEAMLRSVYPHAHEIIFVTQHDRDFWGRTVLPADDTAQRILDFPDPGNKIKLGLRRVFSPDASVTQAEMRNWGMYTLGGPCDYWWVVDTDEIFAHADVEKLVQWLERERPYGARIPTWHYFKSWNYRVTTFDERGQIGILKQGQRFRKRRRARPGPHNHLFSLLTRFRPATYPVVPKDVCVVHHGDFVGDDNRVLKKLTCNGHRDEFDKKWFENIWQKWTPETRDFNPIVPHHFPAAVHVPTAELPEAIRASQWPAGWIES